MFAVVAASWALFLGIGMMMLGNGLQASLLGIRAAGEGFPTAVTGMVMSCYFVGFLAGSVLTPRIISTVGHIRAFSGLLRGDSMLGRLFQLLLQTRNNNGPLSAKMSEIKLKADFVLERLRNNGEIAPGGCGIQCRLGYTANRSVRSDVVIA